MERKGEKKSKRETESKRFLSVPLPVTVVIFIDSREAKQKKERESKADYLKQFYNNMQAKFVYLISRLDNRVVNYLNER